MYVRKQKKSSGTYLSICKNYRDADNKVCQVHILSMGKLSDYRAEELRQLGRHFYKLGGGNVDDLSFEQPQELARYNYGYPYIIAKLMEVYGLDVICSRLQRRYRLTYDVGAILLLLLCDRFQQPISKLASYDYQQEYVGIASIKLHHIYRTIEKLGDYASFIQKHLFAQHYGLNSYQLDVVFYDVTTFYFDSQVVKSGTLPQKGYGKDGKMNKTKVVFGMLIDRHKNPIGYQVYQGNKYEGHTMGDVLTNLKKQYRIGKVIVVADRGMMSKDNRSLFAEGGDLADFEYIIGERLKNLPKVVKEQLTDLSNYTTHCFKDEKGKEITLKCYRYAYDGRTIIGMYSAKKAKKDRLDRQARIEKAATLSSSQLQKKARYYYLKADDNQQFTVDEQRIKKAARFDGFSAIATSDAALANLQVIDQYKHLYQIEQSFRTFKSYLEIRPMFHWTDKTIEGHICLCYIAYCLLNYLQQQLRVIEQPHSEQHIRRLLAKMQLSKVNLAEHSYYMRSAMDEPTEALLKLLKLTKLTDFMPESKLKKYFDNM